VPVRPHGPHQRWIDDPDPAETFRADIHAVFDQAASPQGISIVTRVSAIGPHEYRVGVVGHDRDGNTVLRSFRTLDTSARTIDHDLFVIDEAFQGTGIATRLLDRSFPLYRANGIDGVHVHANIDVGGYTWATAGFRWDLREYRTIDNVRHQVYSLLNDIDAVATTPAEAAAVRLVRAQAQAAGDLDAMPDPHELATIGQTPGASTWAGKAGMLGTDWYGVMHL
jgi:GNAT superfamily N-acetyltransferase